jgi:PKD repeat protein
LFNFYFKFNPNYSKIILTLMKNMALSNTIRFFYHHKTHLIQKPGNMKQFTYFLIVLACFLLFANGTQGKEMNLKAKETLTVVEMNKEDVLHFELKSGRTVDIELLECQTNIVFTTLETLKKGKKGDGTVYSMTCEVKIDGQRMEMRRYVPVQKSFYEPYVVNGLRIWFDGLANLSEYFNENHGNCLPSKDARFAFQDATLPISPKPLGNWCPLPQNNLNVEDCYRGDDTWLGTYYGADLHGGLDINMPSNTPLWAPVDFDEHYYFNSLKGGHNNNRWRGIKHWKNGDTWYLRTHHMVELLIPPHKSIQQGEKYGYTAGVHSGYTPHTHFVFRVKQPGRPKYYMDPWVLFWQIFENNRKKQKAVRAHIEPVAPHQTGEKVHFSGNGSGPGIRGNNLEYFWSFGDGGTSIRKNPVHMFQEPGIYPVSLIVRDGAENDLYLQHITINGETDHSPSFDIVCDDPSFNKQKVWKTNAYKSVNSISNTLHFYSYPSYKAQFREKIIRIRPKNGLKWNKAPDYEPIIEPVYKHGQNWLQIEKEAGDNYIELKIKPNNDEMVSKHGYYEAYVLINHPSAINSPALIRVRVDFSEGKYQSPVIVDNQSEAVAKSNYFWLKPAFHYDWSKGHEGDYLVSANNEEGEFIRYRPELEGGTYQVELMSPAYQRPVITDKIKGFYVRIKHTGGREKIRVKPQQSDKISLGTYEFKKGKKGHVEIISDGSEGLIVADAVKFVKID